MWLNWLIERLFSARFLRSTVCPSLEAWMAAHPVPLYLTLALPIWKTIDWNRWAHFLLGGGDVRTTLHKPLWCWMPNFQPQSFIFCFSSRWCPAVSSKCASTSNHHASTHLTPPHSTLQPPQRKWSLWVLERRLAKRLVYHSAVCGWDVLVCKWNLKRIQGAAVLCLSP